MTEATWARYNYDLQPHPEFEFDVSLPSDWKIVQVPSVAAVLSKGFETLAIFKAPDGTTEIEVVVTSDFTFSESWLEKLATSRGYNVVGVNRPDSAQIEVLSIGAYDSNDIMVWTRFQVHEGRAWLYEARLLATNYESLKYTVSKVFGSISIP